MLIEAHLDIPVPAASVESLPTPWTVGLRNLLLDGAWTERRESPALTEEGAKAALLRALDGEDPGLPDAPDLWLVARTERMIYTLRGRLATRVRPGETALGLILRGAWAALVPDGEDPGFEDDVRASLSRYGATGNLRAALEAESRAVVAKIEAAGLGGSADVRIEAERGTPEDFLAGFPEGIQRGLRASRV